MAQFERRFLVVNLKDLQDIPEQISKALTQIEEYVYSRRLARGANPDPQYITCNLDEPYAEQVKKIIIDGETCKERASASGGNAGYASPASSGVQAAGLDEKIKAIADKYGENCPQCDNVGYYPICHYENGSTEPIPEPVPCEFCYCEKISAFNLFNEIKELIGGLCA